MRIITKLKEVLKEMVNNLIVDDTLKDLEGRKIVVQHRGFAKRVQVRTKGNGGFSGGLRV